MLALIAAVPLETELLRRQASLAEELVGPYRLRCGVLEGHRVVLLHGGVGKANAAAATSFLIQSRQPSAVITFGCGGAYHGSGLGVGDLALATEEIYGDEGVMTHRGFRDMESLGLPTLDKAGRRHFNRFPTSPLLRKDAEAILAQMADMDGKNFRTGPFVTVSTCSGVAEDGRRLARRTGGICENMEGAAVAHVCTLHDVPFLELRGISNLVEDRDLSRWDLPAGAEAAQRGVLALLAAWDIQGEEN